MSTPDVRLPDDGQTAAPDVEFRGDVWRRPLQEVDVAQGSKPVRQGKAEKARGKPRRGRGEGGVWKRADGRWQGRLDLGWVAGQRKHKDIYGRTRAEVASKLRKLATGQEEGLAPPDDRETVGGWLTHWTGTILTTRVANGTLAQATADSYTTLATKHLVPELGRVKLTRLAPEDVDGLITAKREAGYSANTCRLIRSTLRRAVRDAERAGKVGRNVVALSESVAVGKRPASFLGEDQARQLLEGIRGDRLEALVLVLGSLGTRRGEALALAWQDIDLGRGTLRIGASLSRQRARPGAPTKTALVIHRPKSEDSWRTLPLPTPLVEALRVHRVRQKAERLAAGPAWVESGLVFTSEVGTPIDPDNARRQIGRLTERAGVGRRHPHELRHSAASILLAQGVPLEVVSEILGHSSIRVTKDVYGHLDQRQKAQAARAMERALWGQADRS